MLKRENEGFLRMACHAGPMVLDTDPRHHHGDQPEAYQLDRDWAGGMESIDNPFQAREMLIAPMTDSFVQILNRIAEPASSGGHVVTFC